MKKKSLVLFLITFICLIFAGCGNPEPTVYTGFYFDTFIEVKILDKADEDVINGMDELFKSYDALFSESSKDGILAKINSDATEIELDEESAYLIGFMIDGARETEGRYDPTIYGDTVLWDFSDSENGIVPDEEQINEALTHVGYDKISLEGTTLIKSDPEVKLSFGSVAKGYVADKTVEFLKENGINRALINLGGNVYCLGKNVNGTAYNIGIKKPFSENEIIDSITLMTVGTSVVTSGVYERYFESDGVIYHHIFDTSTGYPIDNGIYSVTVTGESSLICDYLSTALFVTYGNDELFNNLRKNYKEYGIKIITSDYKIIHY